MASGMPSFTVMSRYGIDAEYTAGREGWTTIRCASKRAYGCGKGGNSAVQDLDLLLYHGDLSNQSASLSVRAGEKVFGWIDKVIAANDRYFSFKVEILDKGLIVLTLAFAEYGNKGFYYLVFDSMDRSLSMIPYLPDWATHYTPCPLPLCCDDGGYTLLLFGSEFRREGDHDFLYQWSPSLAESPSSELWHVKYMRFPTELKDHFFSPDVLFSSHGSAFWTDLALGVLCCDCSNVLAPGGNPVNFTFIELPPGYQLDRDENTWVGIYRTMACVGGSIRFASIDEPADRYGGGGTRVKVWTLGPSRREWKIHSDIRLKSLFKDVKFKEAGLPKTLPKWPMLRENEGTTLYFIMRQKTQTSDEVPKHYIFRLDIPTKSLLESKLLTHPSLISRPVIIPSEFFEVLLDPLPLTPEQDLDGRLTKRPRVGQEHAKNPAAKALVANNGCKKANQETNEFEEEDEVSAKTTEKDYAQMKVGSFQEPRSSFSVLIQGFDPSLPVQQLRSSLEEHFSKCGKITCISIPASKGKAYMSFVDVTSVTKAICLGGSDLGGYNLYVAEADLQGGFGGTGGRFGRSGGQDGGRIGRSGVLNCGVAD